MQITHMTRCEQVVENNRKGYILCVKAVCQWLNADCYSMTACHGI